MAKKHTGKVIQMLSPENYIRTKARTLPIYECLVNNGWRKEGLANIIISRKHTNGNVTVCLYLVDLFCLGIKDTHYIFNISMEEYQDVVSEAQYTEPITISYDLAHNIIYEALEFAEDFGFKPHKDFISISQFMLEEDTDDIEFFDIECGKNGKPLYLSGPDDTEQKINAVIKQLEKTAGIGNFEYYSAEFYDEYNQDEEEDEELEDDEFKDLTFEEKKKLFLDLYSRLAILKELELLQFLKVSNSIIEETADDELYEEYYSEYSDDLNIDLTEVVISDEMLGIVPGSIMLNNETRELFQTIYFAVEDNLRLGNKLLEKFKKQTPNIPASYFLELNMLSATKSSKYVKRLKEYSEKFPNYTLIRLLQLSEQVNSTNDFTQYLDEAYSCFSLFNGRDELHSIEVVEYIRFYLTVLSHFDDISRILAFIQACEELDFQEQDLPSLTLIFEFTKTRVVHNYLTR